MATCGYKVFLCDFCGRNVVYSLDHCAVTKPAKEMFVGKNTDSPKASVSLGNGHPGMWRVLWVNKVTGSKQTSHQGQRTGKDLPGANFSRELHMLSQSRPGQTTLQRATAGPQHSEQRGTQEQVNFTPVWLGSCNLSSGPLFFDCCPQAAGNSSSDTGGWPYSCEEPGGPAPPSAASAVGMTQPGPRLCVQ